jgi:hypothetical protein
VSAAVITATAVGGGGSVTASTNSVNLGLNPSAQLSVQVVDTPAVVTAGGEAAGCSAAVLQCCLGLCRCHMELVPLVGDAVVALTRSCSQDLHGVVPEQSVAGMPIAFLSVLHSHTSVSPSAIHQ